MSLYLTIAFEKTTLDRMRTKYKDDEYTRNDKRILRAWRQQAEVFKKTKTGAKTWIVMTFPVRKRKHLNALKTELDSIKTELGITGKNYLLLGVWNKDGTQYGQTKDEDGNIVGTPTYPRASDAQIIAVTPDRYIDDVLTPYATAQEALDSWHVIAGQEPRQA